MNIRTAQILALIDKGGRSLLEAEEALRDYRKSGAINDPALVASRACRGAFECQHGSPFYSTYIAEAKHIVSQLEEAHAA